MGMLDPSVIYSETNKTTGVEVYLHEVGGLHKSNYGTVVIDLKKLAACRQVESIPDDHVIQMHFDLDGIQIKKEQVEGADLLLTVP